MKLPHYVRTICVLGIGSLLLAPAALLADPPGEGAIERKSRGGFQLDIGRFTPYARGLKIEIGPDRNGDRSVDVQVRQNGTIPIDLDVSVNPELRGPVYAERPDQLFDEAYTGAPGEDVLGAPSEPDLLGTPDEDGPQLLGPESSPRLEAPPEPTQPKSNEPTPVKPIAPPIPLEAPPEPGQEPLSTLEDFSPKADASSVVQANTNEPPQKAYLGVSVKPISEALATQFKDIIPAGAGLHLTQVGDNTPASKAGLMKHDIIIAVDGQPVGSLNKLVDIVHAHQTGDEVQVVLIRGSRLGELTVQLGDRDIQMTAGTSNPSDNASGKVPPTQLEFDAVAPGPEPRKMVVPLPGGLGFVEVGTYKPGPAPVVDPRTPIELQMQPVLDPRVIPQSEAPEFYSPRRSTQVLGAPTEVIELPSN
ncbi:putative periplasmic serine endoprotease DegP-like precursor [Polystyrenella longa]|uniref:Putative periplasmic serine endoprotease DegP-like n=1 Tax=Polystyrenella longa TaxID=2528007 RepID=A0A518CHH9_9PLAN|nr:PDZ domain-containing protein [Polystyrenella longa]QDU78686.1 putative periplasmic serine endoprotease DegP-like precursor [Polystyrenella longa]